MPFPNTKAGRTARKRFKRSIKRPRQYEALRRKGYSKSRAAMISNANAKRPAGRRTRRRRRQTARVRRRR